MNNAYEADYVNPQVFLHLFSQLMTMAFFWALYCPILRSGVSALGSGLPSLGGGRLGEGGALRRAHQRKSQSSVGGPAPPGTASCERKPSFARSSPMTCRLRPVMFNSERES